MEGNSLECKKLRHLFWVMVFLILVIGCNTRSVSAAGKINVLAINGGDEGAENDYLYSQAMFVDCLKKIRINGMRISEDDIHVFSNPTYNQMDRLLTSTFGKNKSDTLSVFYYSGHGTMDYETGNTGMYTHDGRSYEFKTLYSKLKGIKGKVIVILDCCYSGSMITQNYFDSSAKSKFLILTACQSTKYSPYYNKISFLTTLFTGKKVKTTRYTETILNGLGYYDGKLKADYNKNNIVTSKELFTYLNKKYKKTYSYKHDGKRGSVYIEPQKFGNAPLTFSYCSVDLNKKSVTLNKGKTLQLKAAITGSSKKAKWVSSNKAVATVDSKGRVTAKKAGTATITCTANKLSAKCVVKVKAVNKITLNKSSLTLAKGKSYKLKATVTGASKYVKWTSSNNSVASVSNGTIKAKKAGTAVITAKANGVTAKCKVTVKAGTTVSAQAKKAYTAFMKKQGMYGRYYAILNVGYKNAPILLVADTMRIDNKWLTSKTYISERAGYPIRLYTYMDGKVVNVGGQITQRMSSGPWYVYKNHIVAHMARGGYRTLNIYKQSYSEKFSSGYGKYEPTPSYIFKQWKPIKLTRFTY